ncbi:MAG TPA: NUDIX domain-containing protein [Brevundimonas sp.]|uniref:NUDIX domain-containing protein n=1 Tax=Brevundimonas sp. TaxID=1871086 RepID=UPI002E15B283|nr:NUDIX domain-containing protein [Brevundimonas sp.]
MRLTFGPDGDGYRPRPAAFGLAVRDGRLACVEIDRGEGPYLDLPGGALDGDEAEAEALIREFREETGLGVRPLIRIAEAAQRFHRTDGEALENRAGFWTVEVTSDTGAGPSEPDHRLVWLAPVEALQGLRHEAHAWAVTVWLRRS